ncbi:MAG: hypothetical protein PVH61_12795 [Candidatus Aminicenantes bacterium]
MNKPHQYDNRQKFQQTPEYLSPWYALHFFDTDHVGTLSEMLERGDEILAEIMGGMLVLDGHRLSDPTVDGDARAYVKKRRLGE